VDPLLGLKENVVLGHLIPAGTGFKPYLEAMVRLHAEPPVAAERAAEEQAPIGLGSEVRQRLLEA
jgi:DNA-directed RNA polymerase subunit beta'